MLVTVGHVQTIEPRFPGIEALLGTLGLLVVEEKDIGGDAGIRRKNAAWQADDGVQVELPQQFLLDGEFGIVGTE